MGFVFSLFFIINPFVFLIFYYIYTNLSVISKKEKRYSLRLACFFCAFMVSIINMVKIPENDLVVYLELFKNAKNYSFVQYMFVGSDAHMSTSKEPIYAMLVWVLYHVLDGNIYFFKFVFSLINYAILTYSVVLFGKKIKVFPFWMVLTGIYMMTFIPWIFTMSMQLLRQFFAGSILVFLLVRTCFYKKRDYWLIFSMPLIHSTAWFFVPFLLIKAFDKPFRAAKKWYISIFMGIIFIRLISSILSNVSFINNIPVLSYALDRAAKKTTFELESMSFLVICLILFILLYSIYLNRKSIYINVCGIRRFGFTLMFLSFFILINTDQSELSVRFLFYLYPFVPLLLMLLFRELKIAKMIVMAITLFIMIFFSVFLNTGTWSYDIEYTVWFTPVLNYFLL